MSPLVVTGSKKVYGGFLFDFEGFTVTIRIITVPSRLNVNVMMMTFPWKPFMLIGL